MSNSSSECSDSFLCLSVFCFLVYFGYSMVKIFIVPVQVYIVGVLLVTLLLFFFYILRTNFLFSCQDTGISVRKRVIKILRDICIEQPTFPKITEMCVKMIRRVNDEEGIKVQ